MMTFLEKQIEYIQALVAIFEEMFEEPVSVEFIHGDVFSAAVIVCEEEKIINLIKRRLFNWQLENTSRWDDNLIRITDLEGKCTLMGQNQQTMISQS